MKHERQYTEKGKQDRFHDLKQFLRPTNRAEAFSDVAAELDMSEGAVKVAVHRLRQKFRELLRTEVANTVEADQEINSELDYLLAALPGGNLECVDTCHPTTVANTVSSPAQDRSEDLSNTRRRQPSSRLPRQQGRLLESHGPGS